MIYSNFIIDQRYMHITNYFSDFILSSTTSRISFLLTNHHHYIWPFTPSAIAAAPNYLPAVISKGEDLALTMLLLLDRREESEDAIHIHARHRSHSPAKHQYRSAQSQRWSIIFTSGFN